MSLMYPSLAPNVLGTGGVGQAVSNLSQVSAMI